MIGVSMESGLEDRNNVSACDTPALMPCESQWSPA